MHYVTPWPWLSTPLAALLLGCAEAPPRAAPTPPPGLVSPFTRYASAHYADPSAWLCLPGREDACAGDLDATELAADGTRAVVRDRRSEHADEVDCFYVYPTVDMSVAPANHQDFGDVAPMTRATVAQAARFRSVCRLFVPLYRQVTLGTYFRAPEAREPYFQVASSDVTEAFLHYLGTFNGGRKIVLIGHSQGAEMVTRLLARFFDQDPALRARLLVAIALGGHLEVARGSATGGTFVNLPMCSRPGEVGCVVAYRSYLADQPVDPGTEIPPAGRETMCVDPASLDSGAPRPFARSCLPVGDRFASRLRGVEGVVTPFAMLRSFYEGRCVTRDDGFRYLAVDARPPPGDARVNPIDFTNRWLRTKLGLHILDFQLAQGDLIDLVARRASVR